jgi:hypothetical protein
MEILTLSEEYLLKLFLFKTKFCKQNLWERRTGWKYRKLPLRDWYSPTSVVKLSLTLKLYQTIHSFINSSAALCWAVAAFSVSYSYTQTVGHLGRGISPSQGRYLHTGQHKHRINADRHPRLEWDSNPQSQCSNGTRQFMPRIVRPPRSACQTIQHRILESILKVNN